MKTQDQEIGTRGNKRPPRQKRTIVLLLFLLVTLLGVTSLANRWKGELQVERLSVRGCQILAENDVVVVANVPLGAPLYDVDLLKIRDRLQANAYIQDAVVAHDLPSTIRITVQERMPVAILSGPEIFYVSEDGVVLPPIPSKEVFDLPVITGVSQSQPVKAGMKIGSENFIAAMEILNKAAALDREIYYLISEINLSGVDPIVYTAEAGIPVLFARESIQRQLVYFQTFWNQYVRQQGVDRVRSVDLRFENEVIVRWTKQASTGKSL